MCSFCIIVRRYIMNIMLMTIFDILLNFATQRVYKLEPPFCICMYLHGKNKYGVGTYSPIWLSVRGSKVPPSTEMKRLPLVSGRVYHVCWQKREIHVCMWCAQWNPSDPTPCKSHKTNKTKNLTLLFTIVLHGALKGPKYKKYIGSTYLILGKIS